MALWSWSRSKRRTAARRLLPVLALAVTVATSGCASGRPYSAGTPEVHIAVGDSCPATLGNAADVSNPKAGLTRSLVPVGPSPASGLVCQYDAHLSAGTVASPSVVRSVALSAAKASRLARALAAVSLKKPRGTFHCPMDVGSIAIIALHYAGRSDDVDVWYETSGCQTLENGHVFYFPGRQPELLRRLRVHLC
jgi:hypothetical protein